MADELLPYYERELSFIRQLGGEFAAKYPRIAGRLLLEKDRCEDPHVERLLEAFALLAARVHYRIDADLPEIAEALLAVLYPHYLAPIPSMAIVQFELDPDQGQLTTGHRIERDALLFSRPVNGYQCRFRTCYPVTLWPLQVSALQLDAPGRLGLATAATQVLRLELRKLGPGSLADMPGLDRVRFYLDGESQLVASLYEALFNNVREVQARALGGQTAAAAQTLPPDCVRAVGFSAEENVLPYPDRSLDAYRLLHEYFAFQEKFLFFDLTDLDQVTRGPGTDRLEVVFALKQPIQLEQPVGADNFRLGCTPIVNLFRQRAEPIRVDHMATEYRVIPDVRRQGLLEVHSIESVTGSRPDASEPLRYEPFYSIKHVFAHEPGRAYWHAHRRPSQKRLDAGTEVHLSLVDVNFRPTQPASETLVVDTWCTNRDLPGKLPFGGEGGEFQLEGAAPIRRIRCLTKPTESIRPPLRSSLQWRLISHLSLNYLSISDGPDALQEILRLYDFSNSVTVQQRIAGITKVSNRRVVARPESMIWDGFCRGIEIQIEFDEEKYVGMGLFLFATVLERFLGLYASLNSFIQLVATTKQREEPLRRWPPRAGVRILL
jgi:type VI secretion system protein ImpG